MTSPTIVKRYANALADIVLAPGSGLTAADVIQQLQSFDDAAKATPQLQTILASPAVSSARKRVVIRAVSEKLAIDRLVVNFLLVLSDRRRWSALHEVVEALDGVLDSRLGFERVDVASASELNEAQRNELSSHLARVAGRQIRLRVTIDPSLIGGVTARIGSTSYDGSVRGHLAKMRRSLADAQAWSKRI